MRAGQRAPGGPVAASVLAQARRQGGGVDVALVAGERKNGLREVPACQRARTAWAAFSFTISSTRAVAIAAPCSAISRSTASYHAGSDTPSSNILLRWRIARS